MRRTAILLATALCLPMSASAEFWAGSKLADFMRQWEKVERRDSNLLDTDYLGSARFSSYIVGVHDAFDGTFICTPGTATVGTITAVVAKYLQENPAEWPQSGDRIVLKALTKAFPCKK